jgi:hypothetical protein
MSRILDIINTSTDNFYNWIGRTNDLVDALKETVTVKANTAGDMTSGNGFVNGYFGANTLTATYMKGGNVQSNSTLTFTSNVNIGDATFNVTTLHNNVTHTVSNSYTTTNSDIQIIDSFSTVGFRSGKYLISIKNTNNTDYQSTEIMVLQDDANVYITEYATLLSNATLGTFTANVDSTTVRFYIDPVYANNVIKYQRTLMTV